MHRRWLLVPMLFGLAVSACSDHSTRPEELNVARGLANLGPNTLYGDADLDGIVDMNDALLVANWGVGNLPAPAPGNGAELAANVAPGNGPDAGGPADTLPPGWEFGCTRRLDLLDALAIANAAVGNPVPIAGTTMPPNTAEFPSGQVRGGVCGSGRIPLIDLGTGRYLGQYQGGLYPGGSNVLPGSHATAGAGFARRIAPRNQAGNISAAGTIVLLSIGMSNATQEWCSDQLSTPCLPWSLMSQAAADPAVNHSTLILANGARGGETAPSWDAPTDPMYDWVRDSVLAPKQLSERQVQAIWLKDANGDPVSSLPSAQADAFILETELADIVRALKIRYPNLQLVFLSSRIYGGFATSRQNPEPFAYESGFAVKWVIEGQISQMQTGAVDSRAGDLNYNTGIAPWLAWGPYLWADGYRPRNDGLRWALGDFESDGMHPGPAAELAVAGRLLSFFKNDPRASCWFLAGQVCQ